MKKNISVPMVIWEMLLEVSKKSRRNPERWIEDTIKEHYKKVLRWVV